MKLIIMADSHDNSDSITLIKNKFPDAYYFVHCGDSKVPPSQLNGFIAVSGNVDSPGLLPEEKELIIDNCRIWITHGHKYIKGDSPDYKALAREAKSRGYDCVLFGHTHTYYDNTIDGVRLLNPGSVWKTRDPNEVCSLMILTIDNGKMIAERINYITLLFS